MNATIDTLTRFNQQVLQCQDDAYTLAWYLLGDPTQAEAVTQAAVIAAYRVYAAQDRNGAVKGSGAVKDTVRRLILKEVLRWGQQAARRAVPVTGRAPCNTEMEQLILSLPQAEREALILLQILGLRYTEAAAITGLPVGALRRNSALAMRKALGGQSVDVGRVSVRQTGQPTMLDKPT